MLEKYDHFHPGKRHQIGMQVIGNHQSLLNWGGS